MESTEKIWDKMSTFYDEGTKRFETINKRVIQNTKKYLKVSDIVLEVGCGTGNMTVEIAGQVNAYQATDISSGMLGIAERKANERHIGNIRFTQTTLFADKFKRASFDVILVFNVLHLIEDKQKAVKRINELLKPGGFFISVTPCSGEKKKSLNTILKSFLMLIFLLTKIGMIPFRMFFKIAAFKIAELKDLITVGNFQLVETENLHGPEEHYFIAARKRILL